MTPRQTKMSPRRYEDLETRKFDGPGRNPKGRFIQCTECKNVHWFNDQDKLWIGPCGKKYNHDQKSKRG